MNKINKRYKIGRIKNRNNYNRILSELRKLEEISEVNLNKDQQVLSFFINEEEKQGIDMVESKVLKACQKYEKNIILEELVNTESFRKVLILKGLDCGHCATRIENLAKKTFDHELIMVDFATERFIIETTDRQLGENIIEEVTKIAKKIDPNVQVMDVQTKKKTVDHGDYRINKNEIFLFILGIVFLLLAFVTIPGTFIKGIDPRKIIDLFVHAEYRFSLYSTICLLISFLFIGNKVIVQFVRNLLQGRIFDENFLMTTASLGAIFTNHNIEAVMVMMFYQIGSFLQQRAVNHSRRSISELLSFESTVASLKIDNEITEVEVESIVPGDIIIVKTGEMVPLDGKIIEGKTYLDTKALTGESLYKSAKIGDEVLSGVINMGGLIEVEVKKAHEESMMAKIIEMVENASTQKAKSEEFIGKFARYYTPIVSFLALVVALVFPLVGKLFDPSAPLNFNASIYKAMIFLVISCPCALVISIPLSFFAGIGIASKRGILIKGSNYLEALNNVEQVIFDKTGTITKGEFGVKEVVSMNESIEQEELHRLVAYGEYYSTHPIGMSIVDEYGKDRIFPEIIDEFVEISGRGVRATINGAKVMIGNGRLMRENKIEVPKIEKPGMILYLTKDKVYQGYVVVGDMIRDEAHETIQSLRKKGIRRVHLLTGDSKSVGDSVANALGIDEVYCELLPNEKVEKLNEIRAKSINKTGKTIYVGDGVNDAPVIGAADVGIAMGATGSDAAIAIADVVIMSDNLEKVNETITIAQKTRALVVQNIALAIGIKVFVLLLSLLGSVTIWLAIFSDVGVSLIAILNAMRVMRLYKHKSKEEENKTDEE